MQLNALFGTILLMTGGFLALQNALQKEVGSIPIVSAPAESGFAGAINESQVSLVPSARSDIYFEVITQRPVFEETRQPRVAEPVSVEIETAPLPSLSPTAQPTNELDIHLLGVLTGSSRNSAFVAVSAKDPEWILEGAEIEGWKLSTITPSHVILTRGDRHHRVELHQR